MNTIIQKIGLILMLLILTHLTYAQNKWDVDNVHSAIKFSVVHMQISEVEGNFKTYEGTIESSKPDFTDAQINFSVDVASINTENEMRDKHLKSADFFDADKFPKMTFKSTSFKKIKDKKYELEGDLTIHSITKKVKFDVTYGGTIKDSYGKTRAGFKATTIINRFDYGLNWNQLIETGEFVASKEVSIILNLEFIKQ